MHFNAAVHTLFSRLSVVVVVLAMLACSAVPAEAQGRSRRGRAADRDLVELLAPVVDEVRHSVVTIIGDGEILTLGTIVDERGYILTKASEVLESDLLFCKTSDDQEFEARVVGRDNANDLVMLHISAQGLTAVELVDESMDIGDWVIVAGPEAAPRQVGIVSTQPRAVPPNRLVLGVMLAPDGQGLVVTDLTDGYGAATAGVEIGDIITHMMGKKVIAIQQVVRELQGNAVGDRVVVAVLRDGDKVEMEIELREMEPDPGSRGERMNRMGGAISRRHVGFERVVQHDAEIRPRDCGGPLVNLEGRVVGINIARAGRIATYALPVSLLNEKIEQLIAQDLAAADQPESAE